MSSKAVTVVYPGPEAAVEDATGRVYKQGEPIWVPLSIAEALVRQGFSTGKGEAG